MPAPCGVFCGFEDEYRRALAEIETRTLRVKRTAVLLGADAERVESIEGNLVEFVGTCGDGDVAEPLLQPEVSQADGVRAGGAGVFRPSR